MIHTLMMCISFLYALYDYIKNKRLNSELVSLQSINGIYASAIKIYERREFSSNFSRLNTISKVQLDDGFLKLSSKLFCLYCNQENSRYARICSYCNNSFPDCTLCKKPTGKDEIAFCPFCNTPYHKLEFFEWLKVKAYCKNCKNKLGLWEFQKYLEEREEDHELHSKLCIKCKKHIPMDADFCIYCGLKI